MMRIWYGKKLPEKRTGLHNGNLKYDLHERENFRKVAAYEVPNVIYDFRGEPRPDVVAKGQKRKALRKFKELGYTTLEANLSGPFLEIRRKKREARPLPTA